jgi:hypothetical protein
MKKIEAIIRKTCLEEVKRRFIKRTSYKTQDYGNSTFSSQGKRQFAFFGASVTEIFGWLGWLIG